MKRGSSLLRFWKIKDDEINDEITDEIKEGVGLKLRRPKQLTPHLPPERKSFEKETMGYEGTIEDLYKFKQEGTEE